MCEFDGYIDWKMFCCKISFRPTDHNILERAKNVLDKFTDMMYHHLITPKDAFRFFDKDCSGVLTFDEFLNVVKQIYKMANEEEPIYNIVKDLFEYIDKR